jgi:hypothetical protein
MATVISGDSPFLTPAQVAAALNPGGHRRFLRTDIEPYVRVRYAGDHGTAS